MHSPTNPTTRRPLLLTAVSLLFTFGVLASGTAAWLLLFPGTALDVLWRANPRGHQGFVLIGRWALPLLLTICALCATSAVGLWRLRRWGWWTAISLLCVNLLGDAINSFVLRDWRTLVGIPIAAAIITYLVRKRRMFAA